MDRMEFIVETPEWKSLYRSLYKGSREQLLAFTAIAEGTIHEKLPDLFPEVASALKGLKVAEASPALKEIASAARKVIKESGVKTELNKFLEMWVLREILDASGLKVCPDKTEVRGAMKKI
jgi:hypothetical protein